MSTRLWWESTILPHPPPESLIIQNNTDADSSKIMLPPHSSSPNWRLSTDYTSRTKLTLVESWLNYTSQTSVWVHGIPSIASPHNPSNYRKQIRKVLPGVACIFCVDMENKWTAGEVIKLETDGNGGVLVNHEPCWHSERWLWWCHSRPQGDVGGQMNICS